MTLTVHAARRRGCRRIRPAPAASGRCPSGSGTRRTQTRLGGTRGEGPHDAGDGRDRRRRQRRHLDPRQPASSTRRAAGGACSTRSSSRRSASCSALLLAGNRLTLGSPSEDEGGFLAFIWLPVVPPSCSPCSARSSSRSTTPANGWSSPTVAGLAIGVGIGLLIREEYRPALDIVPLIVWTAIVARRRRRRSTLLRSRPPLTAACSSARRHRVPPRRLGLRPTSDRARCCPSDHRHGRADGAARRPLRAHHATPMPGRRATHRPPLARRHLPRPGAVVHLHHARRSRRSAPSTCRSSTRTPRSSSGSTTTPTRSRTRSHLEHDELDEHVHQPAVLHRRWCCSAIAVVVGVVAKRRTGAPSRSATRRSRRCSPAPCFVAFAAFTSFRGTIVNNLWWVSPWSSPSTAHGPRRGRARRPGRSTRRSPSR